jgi:hypothetical protein
VRAPDGPAVTVEPLAGPRVVADPSTIDAISVATAARSAVSVLRFAPDEIFVLGAADVTSLAALIQEHLHDPHAIIEDETGFVAVTVDEAVVARHAEWPLPPAGGFAQGAIAGVPAKLTWLPGGRARIVTHAAYVADLLDRLT